MVTNMADKLVIEKPEAWCESQERDSSAKGKETGEKKSFYERKKISFCAHPFQIIFCTNDS